jgi:hypothetical protein
MDRDEMSNLYRGHYSICPDLLTNMAPQAIIVSDWPIFKNLLRNRLAK